MADKKQTKPATKQPVLLFVVPVVFVVVGAIAGRCMIQRVTDAPTRPASSSGVVEPTSGDDVRRLVQLDQELRARRIGELQQRRDENAFRRGRKRKTDRLERHVNELADRRHAGPPEQPGTALDLAREQHQRFLLNDESPSALDNGRRILESTVMSSSDLASPQD